NIHYQGMCLKTPARIKSAARNAASTAQVSSDTFQRFPLLTDFTSVLIAFSFRQETCVRSASKLFRSPFQNDARISDTSLEATRPTINNAGAGSFSSRPS